MFLIIKEWGEYSGQGYHVCFAAKTNDEAEQAVETLKKIDEYNNIESKKMYSLVEEYKKTLGYRIEPDRPHKSSTDPKGNISQKDWLHNYILPYQKLRAEISAKNHSLYNKVLEFIKNNQPAFPEEFLKFQKHIGISCYTYSVYSNTYLIQQVEVL